MTETLFSVQEDRFDQLTHSHQLESTSQRDEIDRLKTQLAEAEALLAAGQTAESRIEETEAAHKASVEKLQESIQRTNVLAKEEEEKRIKAVSLLKTVRQKLVKTEKDKEDVWKEFMMFKEKAKTDKESGDDEKEKLRSAFEHDLVSKSSQISTLEFSLRKATQEKNDLFENLELRQAELESARLHLESTQSHNTELQHRLRELDDRCSFLMEGLAEAQQEHKWQQSSSPSADELASFKSATEARYETMVSGLKNLLEQSEKERHDDQLSWIRKLHDKGREVDELKMVIQTTADLRERHEHVVADLETKLSGLESERRVLQEQMAELQKARLEYKDAEKSWKAEELELNKKMEILQRHLDEVVQQETRLRLTNKNLREDLRKIQSSVTILERQRNPGFGKRISTRTEVNNQGESTLVQTEQASSATDEVNLEYIRNVVLQFVENTEMRPNLVKVLSAILRFTPQETRRLVSKI